MWVRVCSAAIVVLLSLSSLSAQDPPSIVPNQGAVRGVEPRPLNYLLAPGDEIKLWTREAEELTNQLFRVDTGGFLNMPLVGRVHAQGLTVEQLEVLLVERLKAYIVEPQVVVNLTSLRPTTVSVLGSVTTPGVTKLDGRKSLLDIISAAGGIRPDAIPRARITRRLENGRIPLPGASDDAKGQFSIAEVNLTDAMESNPQLNIEILPDDLISVPRAEMVYVIGDVKNQGAVGVADGGHVSVLQALSKAGGITDSSSPQNAKILRPILGGAQQAELPLDLKKILDGKAPDVELLPEDMLFIPGNTTKKAAMKALQMAIQAGTGFLTFGIMRGGR